MESVNCGIKGICFKYPCLIPINERTIRGILPVDKVVKDEHIIDFFEIIENEKTGYYIDNIYHKCICNFFNL